MLNNKFLVFKQFCRYIIIFICYRTQITVGDMSTRFLIKYLVANSSEILSVAATESQFSSEFSFQTTHELNLELIHEGPAMLVQWVKTAHYRYCTGNTDKALQAKNPCVTWRGVNVCMHFAGTNLMNAPCVLAVIIY